MKGLRPSSFTADRCFKAVLLSECHVVSFVLFSLDYFLWSRFVSFKPFSMSWEDSASWSLPFLDNVIYWAVSSVISAYKHAQNAQIQIILFMRKSLIRAAALHSYIGPLLSIRTLGRCSPFIHSVLSNDSVCRQRRPWSACTDAHADLGLCCPHMSGDVFAWRGSMYTL